MVHPGSGVSHVTGTGSDIFPKMAASPVYELEGKCSFQNTCFLVLKVSLSPLQGFDIMKYITFDLEESYSLIKLI